MNRDAAGSLLARPRSMEEQELTNYWRKRATIYILGTVFIDQFITLAVETVAFLIFFQGRMNISIDDPIMVKIVSQLLHR
jgi:hypothetical protein